MGLIIGVDEAGYGPKLGPFVVVATVWEFVDASIFENVKKAFASLTQPLEVAKKSRVHFADSKKLYGAGNKKAKALDTLELPLVGLLRSATPQRLVSNLGDLLKQLAPGDAALLQLLPWYSALFDALHDDCEKLNRFPSTLAACNLKHSEWARISEWLSTAPVRPIGIAARILDPREFNSECERVGNKASLLSETSIGLASQCMLSFPQQPTIDIFCDRHGGRKNYGPLLQHCFPESFPRILSENSQESCYEVMIDNRPSRWSFTVGGDSFVPVAAASIVAKYLRERLMDCVNRYWQIEHSRDLLPTAGYPVDAARFVGEILPSIKRLRFQETDILRSR